MRRIGANRGEFLRKMTDKPRNRFFVYMFYRPWDMTPCYVGKGSGNRIGQHFADGDNHHNPHLANIMKKAGGKLPYVILHDHLDEGTAFEFEIATIASIGRKAKGGPLVNMTDGGEGISGHRFKMSPEGVEKIRAAALKNGAKTAERNRQKPHYCEGRKLTDEHKAKLSIASASKRHTAESKKMQSEKRTELWKDPQYRSVSENHLRKMANIGAAAVKEKWKDPEFRAAQIEKRIGKKRTPEQCENIRRARIGKFLTPEQKEVRRLKMLERGTSSGRKSG